MNSVLILPEEIDSSLASVGGDRARHLIETHALQPGLTVTAGVLGGKRGKATVQSVSSEKVVLQLQLTEEPLPRAPLHVIVGVPRPQTVKKVLNVCAMMGVSFTSFIRSEMGEKSYLLSHALRPKEIEEEIFKGLEQSGDTIPPAVAIYDRFKPFVEDVLPRHPYASSGISLIGSTEALSAQPIEKMKIPGGSQQPVTIAIGPEAGWSPYELERFISAGFVPAFLGPRTLRVETALTVFLAQIELLRA